MVIAVVALVISALSVGLSAYLYRRELEMTERHYLSELWDGVLSLAHENPRYLDINVTENYRRAMAEDERLRYDIYCHKAWGQVKEVVDRGYHTNPRFQVAIQWLVTFHFAWLEDNPAFFIGEEFWAAVDKGKSMPAVILRHRRMPTDADNQILWDEIADEYHSLVLSPLNPVMLNGEGGNRNTLIDDLRDEVRGRAAHEVAVEVADFGCGTGNLLDPIRGLPLTVVGVDSSEGSLAVAERRAKDLEVPFEPLLDDLRTVSLGRKFPIIVSINSILPETRDDVERMLGTVRAHLADDGKLFAILPSFDTTEYLRDLWYEQYLQISGSPEHALRVTEALKASKLSDAQSLRYADDGYTRQCYHTPESIGREFAAAGLELVGPPSKIYYPWDLCRRFDYGYFPDADEEIWDWYVVAQIPRRSVS